MNDEITSAQADTKSGRHERAERADRHERHGLKVSREVRSWLGGVAAVAIAAAAIWNAALLAPGATILPQTGTAADKPLAGAEAAVCQGAVQLCLNIPELSVSADAPSHVAAGGSFSFMAQAWLEDYGVTIVRITAVDNLQDDCSMTSVTVTGGTPLGNDEWILARTPLTSQLNDEIVFRTLPPLIRITIGFTSDNVQGACHPAATFENVGNPLSQAITLVRKVIVQLPAIPMAMGVIHTVGSFDAPDGAVVEVVALPVLAYTVVSPDPKVTLTGTGHHSDGWDWGDYGRFHFKKDQAMITKYMYLAETGDSQVMTHVAGVNHAPGKTVETEFCFKGQYVDGGLFDDDPRGAAMTCGKVVATEPSGDELDGLTPEVCRHYWSPVVQIQLSQDERVREPGPNGEANGTIVLRPKSTAYVQALDGEFAGTWLNLDRSRWDEPCQPYKPDGRVEVQAGRDGPAGSP